MPAISFQNVGKTYTSPRGALHALDDVSFDIEPGEFFGLLGPNGAGKTTLISILAGLARATRGKVSVLGHDVVSDFATARRSLGVITRNTFRCWSGLPAGMGVQREVRASPPVHGHRAPTSDQPRLARCCGTVIRTADSDSECTPGNPVGHG